MSLIPLQEIQKANNSLDLWILADRSGFKPISYSQISLFHQCNYKWKRSYIDKDKDDKGSIHFVFGNSMHTIIQQYITTMYNESIVNADKLDLNKRFYDEFVNEFKLEMKKTNGVHFTTKKEMAEFYQDGVKILEFFRKNRGKYFRKKNYELVGVEVPILEHIDFNQRIMIMGFLDVVIRDKRTGKIYIYDIKTSTRGWDDWQKKDFKTAAQLILYKKYYSKQYNVPLDKIEIQYFILKRKIWENSEYPIPRIQKFEPAHGTVNLNKAEKLLNEFVEHSFDENANIKRTVPYVTNPTKLCDWCHLKNRCPAWK